MNGNKNELQSGIYPVMPQYRISDRAETFAPRKMSLLENVVLTIKILSGFGVLGAALWGISLWTAVK